MTGRERNLPALFFRRRTNRDAMTMRSKKAVFRRLFLRSARLILQENNGRMFEHFLNALNHRCTVVAIDKAMIKRR